ncbi:putative F-box/FBD/LRR-repeat protein At4g13965 [Rosa rugosa]|uniref:putative F-box/FBD/LRR-repeat protein At4g13965 n=1 Tax=Rosa rugosa TaxID=74645 RepID=UPI002B409EAD|nr:putative F-box/FBD/LRR-repeat protein At4g13965 [Rosa rugosa]XP_062011814.1 putative F-box/FBD/LRR-repeat protein At4g13965 [Rosa rugosa]XP_062011815.1 putative F-box/FBD/LRR-repeat protein At4g13965 [Rosa rugosa]
MDSESKRPAIAEDRISALPDAVLCHILSCLQPEFRKCAVSTSILSKRWKNIWAYVPNLYFDNHDFPSSADFIAFVDRALQIRNSSAIQKFHLHFDGCQAEDFCHIDDWISTAVKCNVVELDLSVNPHGEEMFELPESLLTCGTLMVWKLWSNPLINIPKAGCYPSLKELHLKFMYPDLLNPENDFMDFSQFPVLEYLWIDGYLGFKSFTFIISGPELKTLRINAKSENDIRVAHVFYINAPKLERLDVQDDFLSHYTFVNTRSLVEANVRAYPKRATEFLAGISSVKCLAISSPFLRACSVAAFDNLRELKVVLEMDYFKWSLLTKVLGILSNLESLVVEHERYEPPCYRGDSELVIRLEECQESKEVFADVLRWSPPEFVPNCLLSHLKTICIKGFKGSRSFGYRDEKEVIKYLLKNGQVLQKMTIYSPGLSRGAEKKLDKELSVLEWGSKTCQVEVITKVV